MTREEAIEVYHGLLNQKIKEAFEVFAPELRESEDERIRKFLIELLSNGTWREEDPFSPVDCVNWLEKQREPKDKGEISDGYHTFNELYYYRMLYNAAFFNSLPKSWVHKSKKHHDGEDCFGGGWFIVMANLPTGQISNHYELEDWDLFQIPEKAVADKWDGHTPQKAAERLHKYLLEKQKKQKPAEYLSKEKVFAIMNKLTSLSFCVPLGSDEEKKIHEITCDVSSLLDYPIEKQKEQKPAECKLEDAFKNYTDAGITISCGDMIASPVSKPLFKKGDWVVYDGVLGHGILQVKDIKAGRYTFVDNESTLLAADSDKCLRPLTPKDLIKPAEWSEEDERKLNRIYEILGYAADDKGFLTSKRIIGDNEAIALQDFLKSLRPQPKNEWSEEDERMLNVAIKSCKQTIEDYPNDKVRFKDCIAWLKSLHPQPHWKPSEEQKPETKLTRWVARDENGEIYAFEDYPEKDSEMWIGSDSMILDRKSFPDLKWEDEPMEVEITIRKK